MKRLRNVYETLTLISCQERLPQAALPHLPLSLLLLVPPLPAPSLLVFLLLSPLSPSSPSSSPSRGRDGAGGRAPGIHSIGCASPRTFWGRKCPQNAKSGHYIFNEGRAWLDFRWISLDCEIALQGPRALDCALAYARAQSNHYLMARPRLDFVGFCWISIGHLVYLPPPPPSSSSSPPS